MTDPDKTLDFLESLVPDISGASFGPAQMQALAAGQRVLISDTDGIYAIAPDGTRTLVSPARARLHVRQGTTVRLP